MELTRHARTVTAVDAAPEMLRLARRRAAGLGVRFELADAFTWAPPRRFDVVFFAFWLSHVPTAQFPVFWGRVAAALRPGGRALFVDELPSGPSTRRLSTGKSFAGHFPAVRFTVRSRSSTSRPG